MRIVHLEEGQFKAFNSNEIEAARQAAANGENVLVARPCVECGDQLLGYVDFQGVPRCEEGHHGSRPGVWY